ncbi:hypothetical protein [Streptomyces sp. NPDC049813]|uniref:hypothetical protein n=1 Tax=Streptomyces sp. NPDC049813 TaxID=3365597 RepID=UPI00379CB11B
MTAVSVTVDDGFIPQWCVSSLWSGLTAAGLLPGVGGLGTETGVPGDAGAARDTGAGSATGPGSVTTTRVPAVTDAPQVRTRRLPAA